MSSTSRRSTAPVSDGTTWPTTQPGVVFRRPGFDRLPGMGAGKFPHVETVGFDYGQRHSPNSPCAESSQVVPRAKAAVGQPPRPGSHVELPELGRLSDTALTRDAEIVLSDKGLP